MTFEEHTKLCKELDRKVEQMNLTYQKYVVIKKQCAEIRVKLNEGEFKSNREFLKLI